MGRTDTDSDKRLALESLVVGGVLTALFAVKAVMFNPPSGIVDIVLVGLGFLLLWAFAYALTAVGIEAGGRLRIYLLWGALLAVLYWPR